jgi:lysophospholipase L1-like esterase
MKLLCLLILSASTLSASAQQGAISPASSPDPQIAAWKAKLADWPQLSHYRAQNAALKPPAAGEHRVVFFGSSSTEIWGKVPGSVFFPGKPYINRGISGQTTPQMLIRFQQDVVELKPVAVVFLGGTNDVAGNTGPSNLEMIEENIRSMAAIAQVNGIRFILASQLPVKSFPWNRAADPAPSLLALSAWEKQFATDHHLAYVDYYSALVGPDGNYLPGFSSDGVHPTAKGYEIMAPVVEKVLDDVLGK